MAALLFISFIVLLLIGVPVAFAIAAAALLVLLKGDVKLLILVQRMFASTDSFSLIAVPFFIFAGDLLAKGKVSKVLVEFAESLLGMLKGGLSIVSVLAGISCVLGFLMNSWLGLCLGVLIGVMYFNLALKKKNGIIVVAFIIASILQVALGIGVAFLLS